MRSRIEELEEALSHSQRMASQFEVPAYQLSETYLEPCPTFYIQAFFIVV